MKARKTKVRQSRDGDRSYWSDVVREDISLMGLYGDGILGTKRLMKESSVAEHSWCC